MAATKTARKTRKVRLPRTGVTLPEPLAQALTLQLVEGVSAVGREAVATLRILTATNLRLASTVERLAAYVTRPIEGSGVPSLDELLREAGDAPWRKP